MKHLLVTNDFPPKIGGIQSYLWELWRRLPAEGTTVLTTAYPGAAAFDRAAGFRIDRIDQSVLLPLPSVRDRIDRLADEVDADVVLLDPALPSRRVKTLLAYSGHCARSRAVASSDTGCRRSRPASTFGIEGGGGTMARMQSRIPTPTPAPSRTIGRRFIRVLSELLIVR